MPLFPKDAEMSDDVSGFAPRRMLWTRELGTRKLLGGLGIIAVLWFGFLQVHDSMLLKTQWPQLTANSNGMTLVGTLNSRDSYERNLLKIITANKSSRVVLTEFGWKSIFDERNGPLFSDSVSNAIESAIQQDDVVGYAMLTPFLRATVNNQLGDLSAYKEIREELPITIPVHSAGAVEEHTTLGVLIHKYEGVGADRPEANQSPGEGSASGHEKENVKTISAETLVETCPVILTDKQCEGAWLDEIPGSQLMPTTYTIHVNLSPEGRSRFFQWSHNHINENVVFVLQGQVIAAPRITQALNVSDFSISNVQDVRSANALVDYLKHSSGK